MIEYFNDAEMRNSGVIYSSTFEQIKKLYTVDPEKAGELAISAIELVLTGQISSDDIMIDMMLTTIKAINDSNVQKYETRVENSRQKKIREMKLAEIAELLSAGWKQREIGAWRLPRSSPLSPCCLSIASEQTMKSFSTASMQPSAPTPSAFGYVPF